MNQSVSHSGHGITAIVLGSLSIFLCLLNIVLWLFFKMDNPSLTPYHRFLLTVLGSLNLTITVFGLISSFRGLLQRSRKKALAIIGLVLNSIILVVYILVIVILIIR